MEGTAEPITGIEETTQAILVYSAKFSFARDLMWNPFEMGRKALKVKAHIFRPNRIHYLDNSLGFGTRYSIRVENGKVIEGIVGGLRVNHGTVFSGPLGPGTYWAILTVDERNTAPCDNRSLIQFSGLSCAPTPAQTSSWGSLKAAYR